MMVGEIKAGRAPAVALFVAFNICAIMLVATMLFAPIISRFSDRNAEISENAAQLAHFRGIVRQARVAPSGSAGKSAAFLPGPEERVASADLQVTLKTVSDASGVRLLSLRGLPAARSRALRMIGVDIVAEGSLTALRDMMRAVEAQTPFLFVTSLSMRNDGDGDGGMVRAEMTVQGAMRHDPKASEPEPQSRSGQGDRMTGLQ